MGGLPSHHPSSKIIELVKTEEYAIRWLVASLEGLSKGGDGCEGEGNGGLRQHRRSCIEVVIVRIQLGELQLSTSPSYLLGNSVAER